MELAAAATVFSLFAEPTRVRLLRLLAEHELSVAELVAVTRVPQSSVSTHLGKLRDAGLVRDRRDGASTYYALAHELPTAAGSVFHLVEKGVTDAVLASDRRRAGDVVRARSGAFPEPFAGEMERHYSPGRTWESLAASFVGLLRLGRVVDVGAGDGAVAAMLAPRARAITCVDASERMVAAAKKRLAPFQHARAVRGDMHALPLPDAGFDQALLLNMLVHSKTPGQAVREAARVLAPGGDLVAVTLDAHEHQDAARAWGHQKLGLSVAALRRMAARAGLEVLRCELVARERRAPHFGTVALYGRKR